MLPISTKKPIASHLNSLNTAKTTKYDVGTRPSREKQMEARPGVSERLAFPGVLRYIKWNQIQEKKFKTVNSFEFVDANFRGSRKTITFSWIRKNGPMIPKGQSESVN